MYLPVLVITNVGSVPGSEASTAACIGSAHLRLNAVAAFAVLHSIRSLSTLL
jgi:hypothetical protein